MSRRNVEDIYPLTPLQAGMLFHGQLAPGTGAYVEQWPLLVEGAFDADLYAAAFQRAVDRHPALRTAFVTEPRPVQVVMRDAPLPVERLDWSAAGEGGWRARLDAFLAEGRSRGFDLRRAPLVRLALVRLSGERWLVVIAIHHAIVDGWSVPLLMGDVDAFYRAGREGRDPVLPPAPRFRDYVAWLARQDPAAAEAYWRRALAGFAAPTPLPLDADRGEPGALRAARLRLGPERMAPVRAFLRSHALTPGTLVLGAWALLLARFSGEEDVVFGTTVSGRPPELPGAAGMVGLFINTIPVRVHAPPGARVAPWLAELQGEQAEARQHGHAPLVDVQGWSEVPRDRPLFASLAVFENYPVEPEGAGADDGLRWEAIPQPERTTYPLALVAAPGADEMELRLTWDAGRIADADARRLLEAVAALVEGLAADGDGTLSAAGALAPGERERVLVEWNATAADRPSTPVHERFAAQAARTPEAVALEFAGERVGYAELDRRANRLANALRRRGVGPEVRVGLCLERGIGQVVALLAVLRAGGAYVPLDTGHPPDRLAFLLRDAGARVLVTRTDLHEGFPAGAAEVLCLHRDAAEIERESATAPEGRAAGDTLAYVIHTSGSTGTPKAVGVPHGALANHMAWMQRAFPLSPDDRVLQKTPFGFDASVWEFHAPLLAGATLVLAAPDAHRDPAELLRTVAEERVSVLQVVPTLLRSLVEEPGLERCTGLRRLFCGGEALAPELAARVRSRLDVEVVNLYGPTEACIDATSHVSDATETGATVPIGRPVDNVRAYVLDRVGTPLPEGAAGELCLAGAQLARGYLGRPGATAERFVPDPFGAPGARLYRTGDRARWLSGGVLEFRGRMDFQVKVRGVRIEPGEVEAALRALPGVADAAVVAREDRAGEPRLVAYVVPAPDRSPSPGELREALARTLPEAMLPSAFVALEALPLTAGGKVDRRALPDPGAAAGSAAATPPRTAAERLLARLWSEVLGVEEVGAGDHFFALGGHSLLAMRLVAALRAEAAIELPLSDVFDAPVLASLAARVEALAPELADDALEAALAELGDDELERLLSAEARP